MYAAPNRYSTPEEYPALEARSEVKHEYIDGHAYAMADGSKAHNLISLNIALGLRPQLTAPCQTFIADMKVMARENARYYYPDVVVTCDDPRTTASQWLVTTHVGLQSVIQVESLSLTLSLADIYAAVNLSPER